MKKSDVDLENRRVTVISYKNGRGKRRKPAQPKKAESPDQRQSAALFRAVNANAGRKALS